MVAIYTVQHTERSAAVPAGRHVFFLNAERSVTPFDDDDDEEDHIPTFTCHVRGTSTS